MKTCKEKIMGLSKKWRTYNQICDALGKCTYNYGTIERTVRELVNGGELETRTVTKKIEGVTKRYSEFRRVK